MIVDGMKRCPRCGETKPVSEFSKRARSKDGLQIWCKACKHKYCIEHAEEEAARGRQYRADHVEEMAAWHRQYYAEHAEETQAYQHQWYLDHAEEVAAHARQWRLGNFEKISAITSRRRAFKRGAPGYNYTTANMIAARWEMWGGRCWICGEPATATDHVKPLSKGGSHYPANLRPICGHCNSVKKDKWPYPIVTA